MDYQLMFPSRFIKAADLRGKDVTLEIEAVEIEKLESEKETKDKGIVRFKVAKKALVLNRTNAECIVAMFGRLTEKWIGKRVTLYPAIWNDEPCVRVRGSPDISAPVTFELKLPKKKAKRTTMQKTTPGAAPPAEMESIDEPPADMPLPTLADNAANQ